LRAGVQFDVQPLLYINLKNFASKVEEVLSERKFQIGVGSCGDFKSAQDDWLETLSVE